MTVLTNFWEDFTAEVNGPGTLSQDGATDLLQLVASSLTDAEGDAWFVAVATAYEGLGIITQPTYVQLRNEVNQAGETAANDLFDALQSRIATLSESVVVCDAINADALVVELGNIDANVLIVEGNIADTSDETLKTAYGEAINALEQRRQELTVLISNQA